MHSLKKICGQSAIGFSLREKSRGQSAMEFAGNGLRKHCATSKAQSAMEYLMTYGWAILIIIVVIAVLFYTGVLDPGNFTPNSCTFEPGLSCRVYKLDTDGQLSFTLGQATSHRINVTGLYCTMQQETVTTGQLNTFMPNVTVLTGNEKEITPIGSTYARCRDSIGNNVSGTVGDIYRATLWIRYVEENTNTERIAKGAITTKFEIR